MLSHYVRPMMMVVGNHEVEWNNASDETQRAFTAYQNRFKFPWVSFLIMPLATLT